MGEARANVVFFDVQEAQLHGIDSIIRHGAIEIIDETPIVPMRVASINGRTVAAILAERDSLRRIDSIARVANGGARGRGPRIVATRSVFYPGTERVMGWDIVDSGFKVVLSPKVPELVRQELRGNVDDFLKAHSLRRSDIAHFVCHSGGPKVLEAFEEALEVPREALQLSWDSLQVAGNLSSASVLFVLRDLLASGRAQPGEKGLLLAMGPGFCAELVLLEW
jgi:predicted naringenin-chalcone synthase